MLYLNTNAIINPAPDANIVPVPNNGAAEQAIIERIVKPYRAVVKPQAAALQFDIANEGQTAWKDFSLTLKIHYEIGARIPVNGDWRKISQVEQDVTLGNCLPPLSCHEPIAPGGKLTLVLVNRSPVDAAVEFPRDATVTFVGENNPKRADVAVTGDTLLPLNAQVIPPYPGDK